MAITECNVTETLQVLDPQGTVVDTSGDRPIEDGVIPIPIGQQFVDVTFAAGPHAVYNFDEILIENFTDNPPILIAIVMIVYEDENGFRVMLNASPDSEFYQLRWRITV